MQTVELDASCWTKVTDIYSAIYEALGSHYSACNVNALLEGLYWDHAYDDLNGTTYCESYKLKPPFRINIVNSSKVAVPIIEYLRLIQECLVDAHQEFRGMYEGRDVVIEFEVV